MADALGCLGLASFGHAHALAKTPENITRPRRSGLIAGAGALYGQAGGEVKHARDTGGSRATLAPSPSELGSAPPSLGAYFLPASLLARSLMNLSETTFKSIGMRGRSSSLDALYSKAYMMRFVLSMR